jgi:hypothetical protein
MTEKWMENIIDHPVELTFGMLWFFLLFEGFSSQFSAS